LTCTNLTYSPFVDATLSDGSRLHVVIPDITRRHWAVNIRRFVLRAHSLAELVRLGTLNSQCARFLEAAVVSGLNIVVAGATQSGKTTTLNCLAAAIPPRERLITCEEVFELQVGLPDTVAMQTRQPNLEGEGEIRQRRLIKEALRMRPDRLIVGEVRQEECLDLLIAFNSGIPGMTSVHANSAREALVKLTTLPLLAGENVAHRFILPTVAATIDLIVFLRGDGWGHRRVEEVLAVSGRVEEDQVEAGLVFRRAGDRLLWTANTRRTPSASAATASSWSRCWRHERHPGPRHGGGAEWMTWACSPSRRCWWPGWCCWDWVSAAGYDRPGPGGGGAGSRTG
jgi:pilus assembly protein CpaF